MRTALALLLLMSGTALAGGTLPVGSGGQNGHDGSQSRYNDTFRFDDGEMRCVASSLERARGKGPAAERQALAEAILQWERLLRRQFEERGMEPDEGDTGLFGWMHNWDIDADGGVFLGAADRFERGGFADAVTFTHLDRGQMNCQQVSENLTAMMRELQRRGLMKEYTVVAVQARGEGSGEHWTAVIARVPSDVGAARCAYSTAPDACRSRCDANPQKCLEEYYRLGADRNAPGFFAVDRWGYDMGRGVCIQSLSRWSQSADCSDVETFHAGGTPTAECSAATPGAGAKRGGRALDK